MKRIAIGFLFGLFLFGLLFAEAGTQSPCQQLRDDVEAEAAYAEMRAYGGGTLPEAQAAYEDMRDRLRALAVSACQK